MEYYCSELIRQGNRSLEKLLPLINLYPQKGGAKIANDVISIIITNLLLRICSQKQVPEQVWL